MTLQNRVNPYGDLGSTDARGTLMGNRGGKFHRDRQLVGRRRWASDRWICCALEFKGRHRTVWGHGYTELFFLDELTALAAGHRPCFKCRRDAAEAFSLAFANAVSCDIAPKIIDKVLHAERLDGKAKRRHARKIDTLPDGAMVTLGGDAFAVRGERLLRWTPSSYDETRQRPPAGDVDVLTPPSILAVLERGYRPLWHPSAD